MNLSQQQERGMARARMSEYYATGIYPSYPPGEDALTGTAEEARCAAVVHLDLNGNPHPSEMALYYENQRIEDLAREAERHHEHDRLEAIQHFLRTDSRSMRTEPLDENELAKLHALRRLDSKKLAARLPAWIKKHLRDRQPPKPFVFVPNQPAAYPAHVKAMFTKQSDPGLERRYPSGESMTTAQYLKAYAKLN